MPYKMNAKEMTKFVADAMRKREEKKITPKSTPVNFEISGKCPRCGTTWSSGVFGEEAPNDFTIDCNACGELLKVREGKCFIFDDVMKEQYPNWKSGETMSVKL